MVSRISVSRCKNSNKPLLSIAAWAQYVLDNFATVDEPLKPKLTEWRIKTTLHLSISDKTG